MPEPLIKMEMVRDDEISGSRPYIEIYDQSWVLIGQPNNSEEDAIREKGDDDLIAMNFSELKRFHSMTGDIISEFERKYTE